MITKYFPILNRNDEQELQAMDFVVHCFLECEFVEFINTKLMYISTLIRSHEDIKTGKNHEFKQTRNKLKLRSHHE